WLERAGPRKAGFVAALCWGGGLMLGALGVYVHQLWLLWLGPGVIGGVGLGLGYISPVSTLVKWFPDRRGMATGMAIMGFGGGAMIGSPLANLLMNHFKTPVSVGVWQTFVIPDAQTCSRRRNSIQTLFGTSSIIIKLQCNDTQVRKFIQVCRPVIEPHAQRMR